MTILIFIPARGGSKGIIGKNLIELNGKPLIQYTLETTRELMGNKTHDWLPFISTEDAKISTFCESQGFNMEYKRPKEISGDKSLMIDAILDALKWLDTMKSISPDAVLLLQPTSPLRKKSDIINAIKRVEDEEDFSIISVTRMREHPFECIETDENGWSYLAKPADEPAGRQEYDDKYFFIDGSFYFASIYFIKHHHSFLVENKTQYHLLNQRWSIDIDEKEDLLIAKTLLKTHEEY